jgi:integrase
MSLLSLRTGLRGTEILKLKGTNVDANAGVLHVIAKDGHRTSVRVPADMIAMLQAYVSKLGEPILQTPITGKAFTKNPAAFTFAIKRQRLAPEDGDTLYAITFHTLRHTLASWLAQSGKITMTIYLNHGYRIHISMFFAVFRCFNGTLPAINPISLIYENV